MACVFYDPNTKKLDFLINLSSWINFQDDIISKDLYNEIKNGLSKDFIIQSDEDLISGIKEYIIQFSTNPSVNQSLINSLDTILKKNVDIYEDQNIPNDPIANTIRGEANTVNFEIANEEVDEANVDLAVNEYLEQLDRSNKKVTVEGKILSQSDLITKFQSNTSLYDRFTNTFTKDIFRVSFINFNNGTITSTPGELNRNIGKYKQELFNHITDFLGKPREELYKPNGEFDIELFNNTILELNEHYSKNDPTPTLTSINNLLFTKLSKSNTKYLSAYNALITLENFDNLLDLLTNGLISVDPLKAGVMSGNINDIKYIPFVKNALRQHFRVNEDSDIVRETTALTKNIIQNVPRLDINGKWDGNSYLTLNEFVKVISRINDPAIKTLPNYKFLEQGKVTPTMAYKQFFDYLFTKNGKFDKTKLNQFKSNTNFTNDVKSSIISIYKHIFDTTIGSNSLYDIVRKNQSRLSFNYFYDILSYMNKQGGSEYTSYEYNPESAEYEISTLADNYYEGNLFNYERNLAEYIDQIAKNGDITNSTLNILRNKFKVTVKDSSAIITIGTKTIEINDSLNQTLTSQSDSNIDLNKELLNSITIPSPSQVSDIINGKQLKEDLMNGYSLLELLQLSTSIPFINSSGQLYYLLQAQYKNDSESRLKGDLLGLLYKALKTIDQLDSIYNKYDSSGRITHNSITPDDLKKELRKLNKNLATLPDFKFNKFFTSSKTSPRFKINLTNDGARTGIFKSIVDSITLMNRASNPSVYKNGDNDSVPSSGLMNLMKNIQEFIYTTKKYQEAERSINPEYKNIFSSNEFYNHPEYIKGTTLKTEFISQNGTVVQKNKFNVTEYGISSVILDFYKNLTSSSSDSIYILPTVYADKANQSLIKISKDLKINDKKLQSITVPDIKNAIFRNQKRYYTNILSNIFNTYSKIGSVLGIDILPSIEKNTTKEAISNNIATINTMLKDNWKEIKRIANELNLQNPYFKFIEEVHYSKVQLSKGVSAYRINPFIEDMARIYQISTDDTSFYRDYHDRSKQKFINYLKNHNFVIKTDAFKFLNNDRSLLEWISSNGRMTLFNGTRLNPIFDKFFYLDTYLSSMFMQMSAGEPYAHPSKLKGISLYNQDGSVNEDYYIRDHAARLSAQYKRMVMMQGTIHNYYQKTLEGTGSTLNMAVIEDIKSDVFNPSGEQDEVKALDGSMECTPFQNELENNSMFSSSAGDNRKNFGYNIDPIFGNGLLLKCAIFSITNYRMRKSPEKIKLLEKMSDRPWNIPILNLMSDFNGKDRTLRDVVGEDLYYYNTSNGTYYKIIGMNSLGNNMYEIIERPVNKNGSDRTNSKNETRGPILINTNFKLWKALGGETSLTLNSINKLDPFLEESEGSVKAVVAFMNKTGFYKTKSGKTLAEQLNPNSTIILDDNISNSENLVKDSDIMDSNGVLKVILDQNYVYQPMKYSDIHYLANGTAIKVGATNTNASTSGYNDAPLNYFKVGSQFMGIQMDADHHADESIVTESTQIISTLAANGYTQELADSAYRALGSVVETTLRDYFKAQEQAQNTEILNSLGEGNKTLLYKTLAKAYIRAFSRDSNKDTTINGYITEAAREFEYALNNELFNAKDLKYKIPFSSGSIYGSFITMIASRMNSDSIKRTFSGMGAVICPSYGSLKLYYFDGSEGLIHNDLPLKGYYSEYDLQRIANDEGYYSIENQDGVVINSALNRYLSSGKLAQITNSNELNIGDTIRLESGETITLDTYEKFKQYRNIGDVTILKGLRKDLQPVKVTWNIDGIDKLFNIYDHPIVDDMFRLRNSGASKEELLRHQHLVNYFIGLLQDGTMLLDGRMPEYNDIINTNPSIPLDSGLIGVKINNLNIQRAQAVISKVYKSIFGLQSGDILSDIINSDRRFFRDKILRSYKAAIKSPLISDITLLRSNLNNTRVVIDSEESSGYINTLSKLEIPTEEADGNVYRLGDNGERLYEVSGLSFYQDGSNGIAQEVIVVKSNNLPKIISIINNTKDYIGVYYKFTPSNILPLYNYINTTNTKLGTQLNFLIETNTGETLINEDIRNVINSGNIETINNLVKESQDKFDKGVNTMADRRASKMYRSFLETLRITANRIPAQAFQSIMTMDIVDFSDSEANEVYVSPTQFWLQGSDLDIDKAYITSPMISRDGIYEAWSNLFKYDTEESFELSKQLPYPNTDSTTNDYKYVSELTPDSIDITNYLYSALNGDYEEDNINLKLAVEVLNKIDRSNIPNAGLYIDNSLVNRLSYITNNPNEEERIRDIQLTIKALDKYKNKLLKNITTHNKGINSYRLLNATKNFVYNKIFQISDNLKNFVASQSPINMNDPQEAAAKSESGEYARTISFADPSTKWEFFHQNMAGKEVIGISAVGQKIFLAATQYFNQEIRRLANEGLDASELTKSNIYFAKLFNIYKSIKGEDGKSETELLSLFSNSLSNINLDNIDYVYNILEEAGNRVIGIDEIINLTQNRFQEDTSLTISALISSATDNAKELILSKINAGPELAGVYIYFIIHGIPFTNIADLMTSKIVNTIVDIAQPNRLYDEYSTIDSVLNKMDAYINKKAPKFLSNLSGYEASVDTYLKSLQSNKVISTYKDNNVFNLSDRDIDAIISDLGTTNYTFLNMPTNEDQADVFFEMLDMMDERQIKRDSDNISKLVADRLESQRRINRLVRLYNSGSESDKGNYITFRDAYREAAELKALGQILGINGGIKTDLYGRYNYKKSFDSLIKNQLSLLPLNDKSNGNIEDLVQAIKSKLDNKTAFTTEEITDIVTSAIGHLALNGNLTNLQFDLERFLSNTEYKDSIIKFYNLIKSTINVFDLVDKLPHYRAFLTAFQMNESNTEMGVVKHALFNSAITELENRVMRKKITQNFSVPNKLSETQLGTIRDYIDELLIRKYLNFRNLVISIPRGQGYFGNGKLLTSTQKVTYTLSNDDGLASFKLYMDSYVIPTLKSGYIVNSNEAIVFGKELVNNAFLNNLIISDKVSKLDGSNFTYYRSALNMLNTDNNVEFDKQIAAFGAIENVEFRGVKLADLFFIYNLITHKGRKGQDSIIKILQGNLFNPSSLISDFHKYIGGLDYNTALDDRTYDMNSDKVTINDINFEDILLRMAPIKGSFDEYTSDSPYVKVYNDDKGRYDFQLVTKKTNNKDKVDKVYTNLELPVDLSQYLINSNLVSTVEMVSNKSSKVVNLFNKMMSLTKANKIKLILDC